MSVREYVPIATQERTETMWGIRCYYDPIERSNETWASDYLHTNNKKRCRVTVTGFSMKNITVRGNRLWDTRVSRTKDVGRYVLDV